MRNVFFILVLLATDTAFAQAPSIQWQKTLGGTGVDNTFSVWPTTDGGYITAGYSDSNDGDVAGNHGGLDYWVVKTDVAGNISWQKSLGGSGQDIPYAIQQTGDGGYIVAGSTTSNDGDVSGNHGNDDYWVVKLDASGNIVWQKTLGGSGTDDAKYIQQTSDGGYIVAGVSTSLNGDVTGNHGTGVDMDYWVVRLDGSGNIIWQKSLGGPGADYSSCVQQTSDGGYIVAGSSYSKTGDVSGNHNGYDYWVVKLGGSGNIVWQKSLGGSDDDNAYSIQPTADGGYVVAGVAKSMDGDVSGSHGIDAWTVKLDGSGNIVWQKALGGTGTDVANAIQQTSDGGYIVAGYTSSTDGDVTSNYGVVDYWVVKLNSSGNIVWQKSMGGSGIDIANAIHQTTDGGYIVAGYSTSTDGEVSGNHGGSSDIWIVKLGAAGTLPLNFISFTAAASGNDVLLNWQTANEINTSHFDIEFSRDGILFDKITEQKAFNTGGEHLYKYLHLLPGQGKLYYRLRQVDNNGAFKYSSIVFVNMDMKINNAVLLFPNPTTNSIVLKNIKASDIDALQIIAADGKIVMQAKASATLHYNVSKLTNGNYFMRIQKKNGTMEILPFVKQ